jgi:hypothetical protein
VNVVEHLRAVARDDLGDDVAGRARRAARERLLDEIASVAAARPRRVAAVWPRRLRLTSGRGAWLARLGVVAAGFSLFTAIGVAATGSDPRNWFKLVGDREDGYILSSYRLGPGSLLSAVPHDLACAPMPELVCAPAAELAPLRPLAYSLAQRAGVSGPTVAAAIDRDMVDGQVGQLYGLALASAVGEAAPEVPDDAPPWIFCVTAPRGWTCAPLMEQSRPPAGAPIYSNVSRLQNKSAAPDLRLDIAGCPGLRGMAAGDAKAFLEAQGVDLTWKWHAEARNHARDDPAVVRRVIPNARANQAVVVVTTASHLPPYQVLECARVG